MKKILAYLVSAAALLAGPAAAAGAHERYDGSYDDPYSLPDYGYGYGYGYGQYPAYPYPGQAPYDGRAPENYRRSGYGGTCDDAAAGALVGGLAGAVIGREIAKDGHHHRRYHTWTYRRHHGGDKAAGTLIGGMLGAVVGGAIASNNC
jgi:Glycine zipper 2TM domain